MLNLYSILGSEFINAMEFIRLNKIPIVNYHTIVKNKKEAVEAFEERLLKTLKNNTNYINIINTYEFRVYEKDGLSHFCFVYAVTDAPIKDTNEFTGKLLVYNESIDLNYIDNYEPIPPEILESLKASVEIIKNQKENSIIEINNEFDMQMKRDEIEENIQHALNNDGIFKPISIKLTDEQVLKHTEADRDFYRAAYNALAKLHGVNDEEEF